MISIAGVEADPTNTVGFVPVLSYVNGFLHFSASTSLVVMVCFFTKKRTSAESRFPIDDQNQSLLQSTDRRRTQ